MNGRSLLVLDPGHGGTAPAGASSPNRGAGPGGILEKEVALDLARRTRDRLLAEHTVVLTRDADTNVSLADRAAAARNLGAAVFVSLHLSGSDPTVDRSDVVVARAASPASLALAQGIQHHVSAVTGVPGQLLRADLGQLSPDRHDPRTAACLVEVASLAPAHRAALLADPAYRDRLADALAMAIREAASAPLLATPQSLAAGYARSAAVVTPDIDYSVTGLVEAVGLWADWLARYAQWSLGVPDSVLTRFPHAAICQLKLYDAGGRLAYGTGFYIGDEVLLTCGHNFLDTGWTTRRVEVQPGHSPRASILASRSFTVDGATLVHPRWRATQDPTHDLAVLRVPGLPATAGTFRLANMSLSQEAGIVVCGYGKVDGAPYADQGQRMDGAHISEADLDMVYYPIQTIGGHSGSPVFHGDMVIGVHTGPRIRGSSLDPHQNRGVLLNPDKEDWIVSMSGGGVSWGLGSRSGSGTARGLSGSSVDILWPDVQLLPQTTDTNCWKAAAGMVASWDRQQSVDYTQMADCSTIEAAATAFDLELEPLASLTPQRYADLLASKGPLWICANQPFGSGPGFHAVVVTGMYGTLSTEGAGTYLYVLDPWDRAAGAPGSPGVHTGTHRVGSRYSISWRQFLEELEAAVRDNAGWQWVRVMHARSAGLRTPSAGAASAPIT